MILEYSLSPAQSRAAAVALVLMPVLVLAFVIVQFTLARAEHHDRMSQLLRERAADQALLQAEPLWKAEIAKLRDAGSGAPPFFAGPQASAAGSQMQTKITDIVNGEGATVQRSNVDLEAAGDDAPVELRMTISFTSDITAFSHILYHLRQARPFLFVTKLAMRESAIAAPTTLVLSMPNRLQIDLTVIGYMQAP